MRLPVVRPYRLIPAAEKRRTLARLPELAAVAEQAVYEGWKPYEADLVVAAARAHGLMLWPSLLRRLDTEARTHTAEMI